MSPEELGQAHEDVVKFGVQEERQAELCRAARVWALVGSAASILTLIGGVVLAALPLAVVGGGVATIISIALSNNAARLGRLALYHTECQKLTTDLIDWLVTVGSISSWMQWVDFYKKMTDRRNPLVVPDHRARPG